MLFISQLGFLEQGGVAPRAAWNRKDISVSGTCPKTFHTFDASVWDIFTAALGRHIEKILFWLGTLMHVYWR